MALRLHYAQRSSLRSRRFFTIWLFFSCCFFFSSRRRHTIYWRDWSSDVCSSDLRKTSFEERSRMMLRAAEILEEEAEEFGRLMTSEMGKTLAAATAEAKKCARGCRYYAENAEKFMADEEVELERSEEHTSELQSRQYLVCRLL